MIILNFSNIDTPFLTPLQDQSEGAKLNIGILGYIKRTKSYISI